MSNFYWKGSAGNDANNGTTWALAEATLSAAVGDCAAGDFVYMDSTQTETDSASVTITGSSTANIPIYAISVDASGSPEPPTTASAGAIVTTTTGVVNYTISFGGNLYCEGIDFKNQTIGSSSHINILGTGTSNCFQKFLNSTFRIANSSGARINIGVPISSTVTRKAVFENSSFEFKHANQGLVIVYADVELHGCSITSGSTAVSKFLQFASLGRPQKIDVIGGDLSYLGNSAALVDATNLSSNTQILFYGCKLPTNFTVISGTITKQGVYIDVINCDSGDTTYKLYRYGYEGNLSIETVLVMANGSTEGDQAISWKIATNANATDFTAFKTFYLTGEVTTTGSQMTAEVEILVDSASNWTNGDIFMNLFYPNDANSPANTLVSSGKASKISSTSNLTSSSASWTTTGLANPNAQKLSVTFTPNNPGKVLAQIRIPKASATVYINANLTIN
jgi:hypothetical protein